ncbi:MAG: hypothetical protein JKY37_32435 [Nannocystaceae bacterium]|nr:hypothetical protein [Nannocystaceae bacterium]
MKRFYSFVFNSVAASSIALVGACGDDDNGDDDNGDNADGHVHDSGGAEHDDGVDDGDPDDGDPGVPDGCADPNDADAPVIVVDSDIEGGAHWTCESIYLLSAAVFVHGGTLEIDSGTTVKGAGGSALVIDQDASLTVLGTEDAPVVMTSALPEGERNRGDWGGLVLIGDAPINLGAGVGAAEGFATPPSYGGTDAAHNCGSISYLRVEWAGFELSAGNELNGVTFYACGSDTHVDHLQVHMGQDDGIEMFGGGFDLTHVVVTGAADDSIDCDEGFRGSLQHVFIHQDPTVGDNCLEWSNQGTDFTATPTTGPSIANLTCIGSGASGEKSKGMTLKEGTEAFIRNSVFADVTNEVVLMTHAETQASAESGGIVLAGNLMSGHNGVGVGEGDAATMWSAADLAAWLTETNVLDSEAVIPSTQWGAPDIAPAQDSSAVDAGVQLDAGFEQTSYAGAVEPGAADDWTQARWINYGD